MMESNSEDDVTIMGDFDLVCRLIMECHYHTFIGIQPFIVFCSFPLGIKAIFVELNDRGN